MEIPKEEDVQELMDLAFSGEISRVDREKLEEILKNFPQYRSTWREYETLRHGLDLLEKSATPAQLTIARLQKSAGEKLFQRTEKKLGAGWRFFLSRPFKVAAMLLIFAGVGIYSQYWMKHRTPPETLKQVPSQPAMPPKSVQSLSLPPAQAPAPAQTPRTGPLLVPAAREKAALPPPPLPEPEAEPALKLKAISPPQKARAAPMEAEGAGAQGFTQEQKPELIKALKNGAMRDEALGEQARLVQSAKRKIRDKDFAGALQDLLEAQKIKDGEEIRDLIVICRREMRLMEEN